MDPTLQAQIAQALAGMQQGGQRPAPQAVPPNQMAGGAPMGGQPVVNPMQGIGQVAQAAGQGMNQRQMAGRNNAFPQAPGGIFGLNNPMMQYSMGGGLY